MYHNICHLFVSYRFLVLASDFCFLGWHYKHSTDLSKVIFAFIIMLTINIKTDFIQAKFHYDLFETQDVANNLFRVIQET